MSRRVEAEEDELVAAVILRCVDCRFSHDHKGIWLECRSHKQHGYSDKAANDNYGTTDIVREFECHGSWFEPRLPEKPRGLQRFLCWLRSQR